MGIDNLKEIRSCEFNWVTGLRKNRVVNGKKQLQNIFIPEDGQIIYLRGYGISRCQAHTGRAQRNHIFLAISSWISIFIKRRFLNVSSYKIKWDYVRESIALHLAFAMNSS